MLGEKFAHLVRHDSTLRKQLKMFCLLAGGFFLILALLRPVLKKKEESIMQEGRDLYIALDVSRSMLAHDCQPSRLECAKNKIKELVQSLECQRVALILFSGSAFVQCPLTSDFSAFFMFLDQVDVETISSGTTALDKALALTLDAIRSMPARNHKLLALFTDGEDFSSNLTSLKERVQHEGLTIFTFGVGSHDGAPIPRYDDHGVLQGYQKDAHDKIVISRLNEPLLKSLAADARGMYVAMTEDSSDIARLRKALRTFEKEAIDEKKVIDFEDQYQYSLLMSLLFLGLEWIL
jgi:Ca-activated chloride channel family protein